MKKLINSKVCHNCRGTGQVDGGFKKKQKRELEALDNAKSAEIKAITERDTDKRKVLSDTIHNKWKAIIKDKENESAKAITTCYYCKGAGRR